MDSATAQILINLAGLVIAAGALLWRMGRLEGQVGVRLAQFDDTSKELSVKLSRLDETNGGGFARCVQHTEQIRQLKSQMTEREQRMHEHWQALEARLDTIDE